jgi:predicted RNA-binding Zn-ribbon protein involved in translation (DUF1610 family)
MPDPGFGARTPAPATSSKTDLTQKKAAKPDAFLCERCGEEMFRMHAVWRCPNCGFNTDCCGW